MECPASLLPADADSDAQWAVLDAVQGAIEADPRAHGASVAGEATDGYKLQSVFVAVEAATDAEARNVAASIVSDALATLGHDAHAAGVGAYDSEGRWVAPAAPDIANPS